MVQARLLDLLDQDSKGTQPADFTSLALSTLSAPQPSDLS